MDKDTIDKISKTVYRRFPEVAGKRPKVQQHNGPQAKGTGADQKYLLVYQGRADGPGGKSLSRRVRVVANAKGKIIKITTSR